MSKSEATASQSPYEDLLAELSAEQEALAKALPAEDGDGDEKIAAAAAEGGSQGAGEGEGEEGEKPEGEGDEPAMAKSFKVTLADGSEAEAVDATELVKSLQEQVGALSGRVDQHDGLAKALGQTLELVKGQAGLIKSMQAQIAKLGGEGRGRKTLVTVHEKPAGEPATTMAKSNPDQPTAEQFMVKANAAFDAHKLTGLELTSIDVSLREGRSLNPELIKKVMDA